MADPKQDAKQDPKQDAKRKVKESMRLLGTFVETLEKMDEAAAEQDRFNAAEQERFNKEEQECLNNAESTSVGSYNIRFVPYNVMSEGWSVISAFACQDLMEKLEDAYGGPKDNPCASPYTKKYLEQVPCLLVLGISFVLFVLFVLFVSS